MIDPIERLEKEIDEFVKELLDIGKIEEKGEVGLVEYVPTENEMKIVESLEDVLPQIAVHLIFVSSAVLGRVSGFLVAPRGKGKTKLLKISHLKSGITVNPKVYDSISDVSCLSEISNKRTEIIVEDFSNVINQMSLLTAYSTLVWQNRFESPGVVNIENADVSIWFGIQPVLLSKLVGLDTWKSMIVDRFIRYYILYCNRPNPVRWLDENEFPEISGLEISDTKPEFTVDENVISELANIFANQVSFERAVFITKRMLLGHAILCGKSVVDMDDVNWLKMYEPILSIDKVFIKETTKGTIFDEKLFDLFFNFLFSGNIKSLGPESVVKSGLKILANLLGLQMEYVGDNICLVGEWYNKFRNLFAVYKR